MKVRSATEAELSATVAELAKLGRWMVAHFRPALTATGNWVTPVAYDGKGFPDMVLVHQRLHRTLFVELKSERGKLSIDQASWVSVLRAAEAEVYVWRPSDLPEITDILIGHLRREV